MIGTDPNLDLPSVSDTLSVAMAKVITALETLGTSITDKATPAALDLTSDLSLAGNKLTNVSALTLAAGTVPSAAGSIYYSGGEFYCKDATGTIKLTNVGTINVAGVGGIGGDYSGSNATLNYDLASEEYRLKSDSTHYADVKCDDLLLMEPGASPVDAVRITAQAMASGYTLTLPATLPSVQKILQLDTSGNVLTDNTGLDDLTLSNNKNVTLSGTGKIKHGSRTITLPLYGHSWSVAAGTVSTTAGVPKSSISASATAYYPLNLQLDTDKTITSVLIGSTSSGALSGATFTLVTSAGGASPGFTTTGVTATCSGFLTTLGGSLPYSMSLANAPVLWLKVVTDGSTSTLEVTQIQFVFSST